MLNQKLINVQMIIDFIMFSSATNLHVKFKTNKKITRYIIPGVVNAGTQLT